MATVDVTITITDVDEFKTGFFKAVIKPEHLSHLTDIQFLKKYLTDVLNNAYITGKKKIAQETTTPDITEDIVEVT